MRLLYLYGFFTVGGTGTQLVNRLGYLTGQGVEVHLGFLQDLGGRAVYGDYPHVYLFESPEQARELVEDVRFDLVTVIDTPEFYPALEQDPYRGVLVHEAHTTFHKLDYIWDLRERALMDAILTPSEYNRWRILHEYGYEGLRPVYVVPNALDVNLFDFAPPPQPSERKVVLWVGRLDDSKNWRDLVAIADRLTQARQDCEFWLVGGKASPDDAAKRLLGAAAGSGLSDRLHWIQSVDYRMMPRLYSMASASGGCHLVTSVEESFGMTVIEAMACRCPVAATRVGALPEVMDGPHEAGLFELHDIEAGAATVGRMLDGGQLRDELVEQGRAKVSERYTPEASGGHYLSVIERILAGEAGDSPSASKGDAQDGPAPGPGQESATDGP